MDARFDDSLKALAQSAEEIFACGAVLLLLAVVLFLRLDRSARKRWQSVALRVAHVDLPYRSTRFVEAYMQHAPPLVRAAALGCFAFGMVFAPGLVFALTTFKFDGIGVALIPGVAIACVTWCCGLLLLRRSPIAPEIVRTAALVSLVLNVALFALSLLHLWVVDARWGGPVHECSASVALTSFVFAGLAVPQACLMLAAVRRHAAAFLAV
jgi:hypothetical protein